MSDYRPCLHAVDQTLVSPLTAAVMNDGCCLAALGASQASEMAMDNSDLPLGLGVYISNPSSTVRWGIKTETRGQNDYRGIKWSYSEKVVITLTSILRVCNFTHFVSLMRGNWEEWKEMISCGNQSRAEDWCLGTMQLEPVLLSHFVDLFSF